MGIDFAAREEALRRAPEDLRNWREYLSPGSRPRLGILRESFQRAHGWPQARRIELALATLERLGFSAQAPLQYKAEIFGQLAKPWLEWAFDAGHDDLGLHLELFIYNHYVKARDTEAHAKAVYAELVPAITRGAKRRAAGPTAPAAKPAGLPKIGYFLQAPSMLAHVQTLARLFEALRASASPPFEPIVYVQDGENAEFDACMADAGVRTIHLARCEGGEAPYSARARFDVLRRLLRAEGAQALVWMSGLPWLAYAATAGVGVRLVWYSLKYHVLRLPGIDGYITNGDGGVREIDGHPWQTVRLSGRWFDPARTAEARAARAALPPHRVTLGSLGREEKMANPQFVRSVAAILREHPHALYLWSGRTQPAHVLEIFASERVVERQRFLGWTDTAVASQMIDVYLDTFPAPGGFTVREAMAAGAATVFFHSREAEVTGPNGFMRRLLEGEGAPEDVSTARGILRPEGETLFPLARTPEEYVDHARRILADDALRARLGAANRAFIRAFFEDDARMLASHAAAVLGR